jgi:hypothetical protein
VSLGPVARYLGILAATIERWKDSERHCEHALVLTSRMGARPWLAHTQEDFGRMPLACGEPGDLDKARDLVEQALATYRDVGMEPHAARASARLEQVPA